MDEILRKISDYVPKKPRYVFVGGATLDLSKLTKINTSNTQIAFICTDTNIVVDCDDPTKMKEKNIEAQKKFCDLVY